MSMEWIKDCNQEALKTIIKAAKNIDGNYERMSDSTILKKLINGKIALYQIFEFIKDPPEEVQLAAVMENGCAIEHINDPSEQVQLAAVKKFGVAIGYIKNPSEEIKLAAVKQSRHAIHHIKNPSKEVQIGHNSWYN